MDDGEGDLVKEGDYIVVQRQNFIKLHQLSGKSPVMLGKDKLDLGNVVGRPAWTVYRMVSKGSGRREFALEECERVERASEHVGRDAPPGRDNRDIKGDNRSQLLSTEQICGLRESGLSSTGIVTALIENSLSFKNKTEYSQEKYLKKKEKKYHEFVTIRKPSLRIISEVYFSRDQFKILGLRYDTLSQMITAVNIQPGGRYLLYEKGTQGLVGAAMLNYMTESSTLINLTMGPHPQKQAILTMNFPRAKLESFLSVKIASLLDFLKNGGDKSCLTTNNSTKPVETNEMTNGTEKDYTERVDKEGTSPRVEDDSIRLLRDKQEDGETKKRKLESEGEGEEGRKRPKWMDELERAAEILRKWRVDGLVIAAKEYPLEIIEHFINFIKASRPIIIYSVYKEPLTELYMELKKRKDVINIHLTETWLREHQVLPDRTHPHVNMSPSSGYLLTATIVS